MKAAIWTDYGPPEVLQIQDIDKPVPGDRELLIRNHAVNAFPGDAELRRFDMHPSMWLPVRLYMGLMKPRIPILGQELAGVVEAVGSQVVDFKPGDEVFGLTGMRMRAYAEYTCLPYRYPLAKKPKNVSFEDAATLSVGGGNAHHFIEKAKLQPGEKILINGACGSIGTYAVQLAKLAGAEVTVVDSADKLDTLQLIGADHLIDYTTTDFTAHAEAQGIGYDVILDIIGKSPFRRSLDCLNEGGRYLLANHGLSVMMQGRLTSMLGGHQVYSELANPQPKDLEYLAHLMEADILRAVIDRRYPLDDVVEAHRYIETGQRKGHVVLTVA